MERKINLGLAAVAVGSIALMVMLSIHGLNERAKAHEIARMPVVKMEPVTVIGERQVAGQPSATPPSATQVARTHSESSTQVR